MLVASPESPLNAPRRSVEQTEGLENANAELADWAEGQGVEWAMHGDRWDARYESYLSDAQTEPDPSGWRTDILYRLAD